jgi:hypothetical protein
MEEELSRCVAAEAGAGLRAAVEAGLAEGMHHPVAARLACSPAEFPRVAAGNQQEVQAAVEAA